MPEEHRIARVKAPIHKSTVKHSVFNNIYCRTVYVNNNMRYAILGTTHTYLDVSLGIREVQE